MWEQVCGLKEGLPSTAGTVEGIPEEGTELDPQDSPQEEGVGEGRPLPGARPRPGEWAGGEALSLGFSRQEHWSWLPFPSPMCESEK